MGDIKRFDVFFERHVGFGVRWSTGFGCPFSLSIAFPFVTLVVNFGKLG